MGLQVGLVRELVALIAGRLLDEAEDARDAAVEVGLGQLAAPDARHDGVELLFLARLQHVVAGPHLLGTVLAAKPVGHHRAFVAPLIAQDGGDEVFALRGVDAVDVVVGGHHRPGLRLLDGNLEALQVDLAQCPLRNLCIVVHAVRLLVVGGKVLDARAHAVGLHTVDVGGSGLAGHQGVFRVVFEVAPAERAAHDVEGRGQEHVGAILLHLLSDGGAHLLNEGCVPCAGQQRADGEVGAVVGLRVALAGGVDAQARRAVGQHDGRNLQRVERVGGAGSTRHQVLRGADDGIVAREAHHASANDKVCLVFERQGGNHVVGINRGGGRRAVGSAANNQG